MAKKAIKDRGVFAWPGQKNVWGIRWTENGRDHKKKIGTKDQARVALGEVTRSKLQNEGYLPPDRKKPVLLSNAIEEYLAIIKPTTRDWQRQEYFGRLWPEVFPGRTLPEISSKELEQWRAGRLTIGAKPATVNRALSFLRRIYSVAIKDGAPLTNPVGQLKMLTENNMRDRLLTLEEQESLLEWMAQYTDHVLLAVSTGLRQSEMLNLEWPNIDLVHGLIKVPRSKHGEFRRVPMNDDVREILERWKASPDRHPLFVIPDSTGTRAMPRGGALREAFGRAVKKAKLKDLHWHDLRHAFASRLVMAGVDLRTVQVLMGHKTLAMTMRYAHLAPDHLQNAVNLLPHIGKKAETEESKNPRELQPSH